jgi:hypothetical protein
MFKLELPNVLSISADSEPGMITAIIIIAMILVASKWRR